MKYRIEISGRGGEIAIGSVTREFYDLFQDNDDVEFDDYAWNWDFFEEKYKIGAETEAKVERIIEKGILRPSFILELV